MADQIYSPDSGPRRLYQENADGSFSEVVIAGVANAASFTGASINGTLGTSSAAALAASATRKSALFVNTNAAARVAIHLTGGTAVIDGLGCVTLEPGEALSVGPRGAAGAFTAIADTASSSLTIATT